MSAIVAATNAIPSSGDMWNGMSSMGFGGGGGGGNRGNNRSASPAMMGGGGGSGGGLNSSSGGARRGSAPQAGAGVVGGRTTPAARSSERVLLRATSFSSAHSAHHHHRRKVGTSPEKKESDNVGINATIAAAMRNNRAATWPWHLKKLRKDRLHGTHLTLEAIRTCNLKQQDEFKRYVQESLSIWSLASLALGFVSAAAFIIGNEVVAASVAADTGDYAVGEGPCFLTSQASSAAKFIAYVSQIIVTGSTLLLLFCRYKYFMCRFYRRVLNGKMLSSVTFAQSDLMPSYLFDSFICLIHCPPGVVTCVNSETFMGPGLPPARYCIQLVSLFTLFRIYLLFPYIVHANRFETQSAKIMSKLYGLLNARQLGFRDFMSTYPAISVMSTYGFLVFYFAYFLLCFERPVDSSAHFQALTVNGVVVDNYWRPTYAMCLWFIFVVQSTVGLGDWYPLTPTGRLVTVIANLCGMVTSAMLIATVISMFTLTAHEHKVRHALIWIDRTRRIPVAACKLIALWYRSTKNPAWQPAFSRAQLHFRRLRLFVRSHHPGDNLSQGKEVVRAMEDSQTELRMTVSCMGSVIVQLAEKMGVDSKELSCLKEIGRASLENCEDESPGHSPKPNAPAPASPTKLPINPQATTAKPLGVGGSTVNAGVSIGPVKGVVDIHASNIPGSSSSSNNNNNSSNLANNTNPMLQIPKLSLPLQTNSGKVLSTTSTTTTATLTRPPPTTGVGGGGSSFPAPVASPPALRNSREKSPMDAGNRSTGSGNGNLNNSGASSSNNNNSIRVTVPASNSVNNKNSGGPRSPPPAAQPLPRVPISMVNGNNNNNKNNSNSRSTPQYENSRPPPSATMGNNNNRGPPPSNNTNNNNADYRNSGGSSNNHFNNRGDLPSLAEDSVLDTERSDMTNDYYDDDWRGGRGGGGRGPNNGRGGGGGGGRNHPRDDDSYYEDESYYDDDDRDHRDRDLRGNNEDGESERSSYVDELESARYRRYIANSNRRSRGQFSARRRYSDDRYSEDSYMDGGLTDRSDADYQRNGRGDRDYYDESNAGDDYQSTARDSVIEDDYRQQPQRRTSWQPDTRNVPMRPINTGGRPMSMQVNNNNNNNRY